MTSSKESDSSDTSENPATHGSHVRPTQLEVAQRIARETLEADHQALELDAKLAFRTAGRW